MVEAATLVRALGGVALLFGNGYFVTTEFAMTRVRQFDREEFRGGGLDRAWEMTERLEIYLSGCQVGITVCSVGLGVVAEPAVAALFGAGLGALGLVSGTGAGHTALSVGLSLAVINLLHVIVGEQAPTYLGVERTRLVARYGAPVLYYWTKLMSPVIRVADWVAKWLLGLFGVTISRSWTEGEGGDEDGGRGPLSRGELKGRIGQVLTQGGLPRDRREEVLNAVSIGERPVSDVMVPADEMITLSTERSTAENVARMQADPLVRFPLVGADVREYHGAVYAPDVLREIDALRADEVALRDLASDPLVFPATLPVSEAIDRFQAVDEELALVVESETEGPAPADTTDGTDPERDQVTRGVDASVSPDGASDPHADAEDLQVRVRGEVVGLVTATDAWEAITGDLEDPLDEQVRPA